MARSTHELGGSPRSQVRRLGFFVLAAPSMALSLSVCLSVAYFGEEMFLRLTSFDGTLDEKPKDSAGGFLTILVGPSLGQHRFVSLLDLVGS